MRIPEILIIFRGFLGRYPKQFFLLFLLLLMEGIVAGGAILALVPLAEFILDPSLSKPGRVTAFVLQAMKAFGIQPSFAAFGAVFVAANLANGGLQVGIRYAILVIKYRVVRELFGDALGSFFKARWEFFSGVEQGRLLSTLNKELNTIGDTLGHIATQFAQLIQLSIYLAVPLFLNPKMTIATIAFSALFAVPFLMLTKIGYRLGQQNAETANRALGVLTEILQAARIILSFGRQSDARIRYLKAWDAHTAVTLRSQTLASAVPQFFKPLAILSVLIGMGLSLQDHASVSELAAVLWSLLAAIPILSGLIQGGISISNFLPSYEQLLSLHNEATRHAEESGVLVFESLADGVFLENVSFNYPGREKTLVDVSLKLCKGQMTALVGSSGSGKSTIVDLVLGLQVPTQGRVLLDGSPLPFWQQNTFRQRIGYVPQDPILFHLSIRENLNWAQVGATEDELWESLEMANADKFVRALPQGIDTVVGERGMRLSGGQRQRIALARALLRQPDLLILDEATSALDSESELLIQQAIDNLASRITILVIAHRISTITRADKVYVLNQGCIVEEGTFDSLSKEGDTYFSRITRMQSGN